MPIVSRMIEYAAVILIGLCMGSFLTMASYRLPRGESLVKPRSHCTQCQRSLGFPDLFPLFSWLFQRGKCRSCGSAISFRYPLTELASGGLFAIAYATYGLSPQMAVFALFSATLLLLWVTDLEHKIIPDSVHLFLLPLGIAWHVLLDSAWKDVLMTSILAGGIGLLLHYGYYWLRGKHGLGFGDVKFLFVAGLWLGDPFLLNSYILLSGILGVFTGMLWRFISDDPRFPFGPALALALYLFVLHPQWHYHYMQWMKQWMTG